MRIVQRRVPRQREREDGGRHRDAVISVRRERRRSRESRPAVDDEDGAVPVSLFPRRRARAREEIECGREAVGLLLAQARDARQARRAARERDERRERERGIRRGVDVRVDRKKRRARRLPVPRP